LTEVLNSVSVVSTVYMYTLTEGYVCIFMHTHIYIIPYDFIAFFFYLSHRGINVDHRINVDQHSTKQVQIQNNVFALVS
jgi:hypothetical protein